MVRETRHLWVGNLPENIREDRIREHFKRYGRVQSVKLLPRVSEEKTGEVSMACTVAFMDIKSAAKAHNAELKIDDRTLNTSYYEPAAIPSAASPQGTPPPYSTSPGSTRFPNGHGSSDEHGFPDSAPGSARFYDRSSSSGGAVPTSAPEGGSGTCRGGRNRDRFRGGGGHRGTGVWGTGYESSRYNNSNERSQSETTGYNSAPSDTNDRRNSENVRKKAKSRSGSRSPSPTGSTSSRSPSRSRSRSSSSSSSSSTSRDTSSTSSPRSRRHRHHKKTSQCNSDDRRPLAICVRNLPVRSSDTSLKDGLFHEYKKHGKVTWVKIVGQNADRHAIVCFKKPEDAEKALEVSYDKLFFGCKIEVAPYTVCDIDEVEFRYESEIDEYNPKATRTLFIGNLEKDVTASDLRKHFDQFGEIIEIDIKKQGAVSSYAFCQYSDIVSVVKAIRKMDGEHLGNNRIKLGFGKSMAYNCVWIDGVNENVNEKYLRIQFEPFGVITKCIIDREKGQALLFYEHVSQAQLAVNKMRGFVLKNTKLQVDFASRECQECFFERLEKQGAVMDRAVFEDRRDSSSRSFESSAPRISRYDTPTRPRTSSYSSRSSVAAVASPGTPGNATPRGGRARVTRYYDYDLDYGAMDGRHVNHRSYDEYSQGSAASHEDAYDPYDHGGYLHDSPGHLDPLEVRVVQTLVEAVPYAPHDIRNLQKERVHLLEQLEECPSSGDELISPKKRLKLDLLVPAITGDVIIEANRDHNRKVMEVRRLSESTLRHHSRRPSVDSKYSHYAPHTVGCKRRRTGGSDGGTRSGGHSHYAEHSDGSEHGGSRPGTPLCDENPEFPPGEPPKRTTRDREGPLVLPLPKWAAQVRGTPEFQRGTISVAGIKGQKEHVNPLASPPPAATSPRVSHHIARPPSPSHIVPPPASPPPRPPSLSSNSSDSDGASGSPSLEERIKSLDEKYEKWSGSRALSAAGNDALALLDANREKFRLRHKLLEIQDLKEVQPSEIVKSVMAKRSVFDEDLKRLESVGEKYEPKEFGLFSNRLMPIAPASVTTAVSSVATVTVSTALKLSTAATQLPKTPTMLSPRSSATTLPIPASRGLQYPFPSHPPMLMSPAPAPSQAPTSTVTSPVISAPPATSTSTSVTARGPNLGENRLKPLANAPGDSRTSSVKNRSVATVVSEVSSSGKVKPSEKIILRRNSSSTSPRADVKTRRNSDTSARRIDETEKCERAKSEEQKLADKAKEELEKQQLEQEEKERVERERIEKEKQEKERLERERKEKERLERERKEKERLERESELEKQRLEKERLEKERIQREKEKAEKERIEKEKEKERLRLEKEKAAKLEKERAEKERAEQERLEKERLEQERLEKEQQEKERLEKEMLERLEQEKIMEQEKIKQQKEEQERKQRELQEKLEKERKEAERKENEEREREQKAKEEENRLAKEKERRKSEDRGSSRHKDSDNHHERSSKHRENHSETKHRENSTHNSEKQQREKTSAKESRDEKTSNREETAKSPTKESSKDCEHDTHKRDSSHHENSRHDNIKAQIERDVERRKESIKENRDNNIHDRHKHISETKDHIRDRAVVETRHMSLDLDKNQIVDGSKDPHRRKERNNSLPANIGIKRRMSSHEVMEPIEEPKKLKLGHEHKKVSERRESKDSSKSDEKSKKSKHKNNSSSNPHDKHNSTKESDEKRKEKEREREERHKKHKLEKQKSKSKSREKESKEARESPTVPENQPSMSDKDFLAKLNLRSNEDIEKDKQQGKKDKDIKEKRREIVDEPEKLSEDVKTEEKPKKERQPSFDSKNCMKSPQEDPNKLTDEQRKMQKKDRIRKGTTSDSDSDEPKKHSIFDIVDDGPPYISMYDKVKARSCKNMQKQEEEKRQEKIKAKFSQLKLSRARREEKKRSTSWDEDSDSDKDGELKSRRCRKVLDSSDESQERRLQKRKDLLYSDSDNSLSVRPVKTEPTETTDDEIKMKHAIFKGSKSRITSDTSDDDYHKTKISSQLVSNDYHENKANQVSELFSENDIDADVDVKPEKITSVKTELERLVKKERRNSKFQEFSPTEHPTFDVLHTEPSEVKTEQFNSVPLFDNTTDDDLNEIKKEKSEKREKKHKKKQKKQKHSASSEESVKVETDSVLGEQVQEKKHHEKKRDHSKKDKKRDKTKEGREKSKKSRKNRSEEKSESKHDGKMENIFGSLSEDSEAGQKEQKQPFLVDENAQTSPVFNTDSDKEQQEVKTNEERDREVREVEHKRRKEKRRREKERRLQEAAAEAAAAAAEEPPHSNDNSMDFADMGKQLEANIKDDASEIEYKTEVESSNLETSDTFIFTDQEIKKEKEERKEGKEKKKKRKKSKDEKKHHHHHHHDKNKIKTPEIKTETVEPPLAITIPEIKSEPQEEETKPKPPISPTKPSTPSSSHSQSLPSLLEVQSPTTEKSSPDFSISPTTQETTPIINPIPKTPTSSNVKRETVIPGFGTEIDETIHETAVKSISTDYEPAVKTEEPVVKEEIKEEVVTEPPEDKPRVVISQEETEDAVAALLGESFGSNQFEERYTEEINTTNEEIAPELVEEENVQDDEEMRKAVQSLEVDGDISKPDTPQSEHELQIDTDTEEQEEPTQISEPTPRTPDSSLISQIPKTPDIHFYPSSSKKTPTPSPVTYKILSSPPSLTPIKPQPPALAEVRKNLEKDQKSLTAQPETGLTQRSVIAQTWPADRKEVVTSKADAVSTETKPAVIMPPSSTPPLLKSFSTPPSIKIGEPNYPPLAKLSPSVEPKVQTLIQQSVPPKPLVQTSVPIIVSSPSSTQITSKTLIQTSSAPPIQSINRAQVQTSPATGQQPGSRLLMQSSVPTGALLSSSVLTSVKSVVPSSTSSVQSPTLPVQTLNKPQVVSQIHNLPARSPVQVCKPVSQEGMLSPKSSSNISLSRLPVTPVMVSKPMQATTVFLPQPKVALSSEPLKLEASPDIRLQERPRMIFQPSNMPGYPAFSPGQPPRMVVQGNIRHLPPSGLLVPTRPMNPAGYGFMGNVPHTAPYASPIPSKEVPNQSESLKLPSTMAVAEQKSTIVMAGSHGALSQNPKTPLSCSTSMNPPHLVLTSPKSTPVSSALSPRSLAPLKSPTSSQTFVTPPSPRHSPKPTPVIIESPHSSIIASPERRSPSIPQTPPKAPTPDTSLGLAAQDLKSAKEPTLLPLPTNDVKRSTPSPVIVANPEVKAEIKSEISHPPSPVKLAIEKVTEELNLSLEKKEDIKEGVKEKESDKEDIKEEVKTPEKQTNDGVKPTEISVVAEVKKEPEVTVLKPVEDPLKTEATTVKEEPEKIKLPEVIACDVNRPTSENISDNLPKEEDPLESKDDNEFWSAKDAVNIDSVIKTLGSADEMSEDENKEPPQSPKTPKDIVIDDKDATKTPEKKLADSVLSEEKHDENTEINVDSIETDTHHKLEVSVTRSSSRRGRGGRPRGSTKIKISVERGGIQTRRGKLKEAETLSSTSTKRGRGGKVRPERKSSKSESDSTPNDVYEFRDDSDDCNKEQRPRLVLTIKSTTSSTSNAQTTAIVKEITKDGTKEIGKEAKEAPPPPPIPPATSKPKDNPVVETKEEFTSPQTNTRKSRRLAQKDTSRNTVDDTIEDVIKNTPLTRSASNQRRSGRQNKKPTPPVVDQDTPRKSPRGRKPSRRASEAAETSSGEDIKDENQKPVESPVTPSPSVPSSPSQPKQPEPEKSKEQPADSGSEPSKEKKADHCSLKTVMLKRFKGEMGIKKPEPTNLIDPVTGVLIPMRESEEGKYIPLPGSSPANKKVVVSAASPLQIEPVQPKTSEPAKTQASVIAQPHPVSVVQQQPPKIHSLKAHVLSSAAKVAVIDQATVVAAKPQIITNVPPAVTQAREPVTQSLLSSPNVVVVSKPSTPVLISRSVTQVTQSTTIATSVNPQTVGPPSPRPGIPVAVTSKPQVKPPAMSPSQQIILNNQKHILQAREQHLNQLQTVNMSTSISPQQAQIINTQMAHMKHRHEQVIMGAKGPITKPPHSLHQQHLPGQIASPPVSKAQASGRIIQGPSQAGAKGVMEPPKIDVNLPNIMLGRPNLSPSGPQARLAGLPVPAYEASLGEHMAHFPPGPLRPPDLNPHYMHPQHMMYQQFLRQQQLQQHFQRSANLEKSGEEGEEAPVGLAVSGRGATVPHHSPHDRATESPAIGQVYNTLTHSARLPPYHPGTRYYDQQPAEPPPAHRPLTSHDRAGLPHIPPLGTPDRPLGAHTASHSSAHLIPDRPSGTIPEKPLSAHLVHDRAPLGTPERSTYGPERPLVGTGLGAAGNLLGAVAKHIGVDAPASQRGIQAATPPLASQVPPQAESLFMLLKQYPLMWQGLLALKNDQAAVQMYFVSGNDDVAKCSLPKNTDGSTPPLRIFQRMRLEPMQVEGVARKMQMENEHCMLLALPCGHDHMDVLKQSTNLTNGFITYLQLKQAAGIVNVAAPGTTQPPAYVVHIFPSCDFVNENLRRIAPSLLERVADIAHLLIVITTV